MKSWRTNGGYTITRVLFGRSNVYLLSNGETRLLVDTGWSGERKRLLQRMERIGPPDAVVMTHSHFDHAGNAAMVMGHFSPVFIVQETEKDFLESGDSPVPKGTIGFTRFLYGLGAEKVPQWFHVEGVKATTTFGERYDLSGLGFNACLLHTPGHTRGSASLIIPGEIALVGDAMTGMPGSIFPPWGDDPAGLVWSWKKLIETGCHTFHPSHGFPVSIQRLEEGFRNKTMHA